MGRMALDFPAGSDTLPPGRHTATVDEVETVLVDGFPTSMRRRPLFESWKALREAITRIVSVTIERIDGSYVTKKDEPEDIDLVTHIPGAELEALDAADRAMLRGLVSHKISQALHDCDSYYCAVFPPGHPHHAVYQAAFDYWDKWFGHDRNGRPKGYVEVIT